jgi:predicted Zn finger-like uncharacterized protein
MRIACPNCAAEYDVPDRLLQAGPRLMRCARCAHQFEAGLPQATVPPPAPAPAAPLDTPAMVTPMGATPMAAAIEAAFAAPLPEPAVAEAPPPPPAPAKPPAPPAVPPAVAPLAAKPRPEPDRVAVFGWIATVAVLVGAGAAALHYRGEIVAAWPPAARVFDALGLI